MYPVEKYKYYVNGRTVYAVSTYCGRTVKGKAICASDDEFDIEAGKKLAAARCEVKVAQKRAKRAMKKRDDAFRMLDELEAYVRKMVDYANDSVSEAMAAEKNLEDILSSL